MIDLASKETPLRTTSALTKARAEDPAAWEDLHARWKLARALDGHPQMMAQTAALATARMINAVAWKLPLPAPAWLRDLQERDNVRPLLEAFHHSAASYWEDGAQMFPTKWLSMSVEHDRFSLSARTKSQRPAAGSTGRARKPTRVTCASSSRTNRMPR